MTPISHPTRHCILLCHIYLSRYTPCILLSRISPTPHPTVSSHLTYLPRFTTLIFLCHLSHTLHATVSSCLIYLTRYMPLCPHFTHDTRVCAILSYVVHSKTSCVRYVTCKHFSICTLNTNACIATFA